LDWANEVKLIYRRHDNNHDSSSLESRTPVLACG
jgi:hypothetical protein